jgi:hypothetical protein
MPHFLRTKERNFEKRDKELVISLNAVIQFVVFALSLLNSLAHFLENEV